MVAGELTLLVIASFPLRRVFGVKVWRRLHWATYLTFALATAHGITTGTDTGRGWTNALYIGALASVATAITWRATTRGTAPQRATVRAARTDAVG